MPPAVLAAGSLAAVQYAFATFGWDCVLSSVIQTPDKSLVVDFLMPTQQYSLAVVARRAVVPRVTIGDMLAAWTQPFDRYIWLLLGALLLLSGLLMYTFERSEHSHDDFGPEYYHWTDRLARGVYRATSNWTAVGSFTPVTPAGRLYNMTFAFVMLLMQSAYTANLAAFFTRQAVPVQLVSSIDAFTTYAQPACVDADPLHAGWLASNYANTLRTPVPGTATDVLQAVLDGVCTGGIATDADLGYALGQGADPSGTFCELEVVQSGLGANVYAIPMRRGGALAQPARVRAANALFGVALAYGQYGVESDLQFTDPRAQCTAQAQLRIMAAAALDSLKPLGPNQLAGVFFLQAMGLGVAGIGFLVSRSEKFRHKWNTLRGVPPGGVPDPDATPAPEEHPHAAALVAADALPHPHQQMARHKQIAVAALMSIEHRLEATTAQFTHVSQIQRDLGVKFLMQEGAQPINPAPLALVAKMDRALAFGLRAVGELVLRDADGAELAVLSYGLPSSEALASAHAHMAVESAGKMDIVMQTFLKERLAERRATNRAATPRRANSAKVHSAGDSRRPAAPASSASSAISVPVRPTAKKKKGGKQIPAFTK